MKYKARIEKLDYAGKIKVSYREYEDNFTANTDDALKDIIKTGKLHISKLKQPDIRVWELRKKIAPAKSAHTFNEYEPGLCAIAGEYFPGVGVQYVVSHNKKNFGWIETESDILEVTDGH